MDWQIVGVLIAFAVGIAGGAYAIGRTSGKVDTAVDKIAEIAQGLKDFTREIRTDFARKDETTRRLDAFERQLLERERPR